MCDGGMARGDDKWWCVHVRMMVVYSNIHRELTTQVKGSAKIMVTVVTTQELEAGDVLRRFRAESAQDYPRRGNNNNRYIVVGLVVVGVCDAVHLGVVLFFSFFIGTRMCDDDSHCFSCDVWYFVQGNSTCLLLVGSPSWKGV